MSFTLHLTKDEVRPSLARLASPELIARSVMAAGTALMATTQRAFNEPALRPTAWAARKSGGAHPLLLKSGTLRQSWHVSSAGGDSVQVGNPTPYAAHQQFGSAKSAGRGSGVPARPFFPADKSGNLTPAGEEAVGEAIIAVIETAG
jgi:phage gpG-like protein